MKRWRSAVFGVALSGMAAWTCVRQADTWQLRFRLGRSLREQWADSGETGFSAVPSRRRLRAALPEHPASDERFAFYIGDEPPGVMARNTHLYLSLILRPQPVVWTSAPADMGADWVCALDESPAARAALAGYERVDLGPGPMLYRRRPEAALP